MGTKSKNDDIIRYDALVQDALRSVIRQVLSEISSVGKLPGDHHFYVTFDTTAPGVKLSSRMREKYPEDMTIVIQHQYWDLVTTDTGFGIGLSFNDTPENLFVPYDSVRGFFDPHVQFGLQFGSGQNDDKKGSSRRVTKGDGSSVDIANLGSGSPPRDNEDSAKIISLDSFRKK